MRIVGGIWRGRVLGAPPGGATRPTADRVRQAAFDMLLHAGWGGPDAVGGVRVLDAFAGTGAFGFEALSRGAAHATFLERDRAALAALRANAVAFGAERQTAIIPCDVLNCRPGPPASLVFLDPPYGQDLIPQAFRALQRTGWIGTGALIVGELGRTEPIPQLGDLLADRRHGAARLLVWRVCSDQ